MARRTDRAVDGRNVRSRTRTWALAVSLVTAALLAVTTMAASVAEAVPAGSVVKHAHRVGQGNQDRLTAANKALVLSFYDELFNKANLAVIDQDTGPTYTQHNPTVADGPEGLRNLVVFLHGLFPNSHNFVRRVIAQGDLVLLQSNAVSVPGTRGLSIVDIFRVANGRIVEHWDNLEPVPATTVSGHDLFSTLSSPKVSDPSPHPSTHASERIVRTYFSALTHHQVCAVDTFVAPDPYQHNPTIADGAPATKQYYADLFAANPDATFTVARVVAQGDLVAVHSHFQKNPSDLGQSVVDIYRVQHGKIVEHWDGIQAVPATSANNNTMF